MVLFFLILVITILFSMKFYNQNGIDPDYMSIEKTKTIKGIFVFCVFLSHIKEQVSFHGTANQLVISFLFYLGQFMVTMFLFYSGFGIYESIKKKGKKYIHQFLTHRICRVYFHFGIAVTLFLFVDIWIQRSYTIPHILLSYIGWESIGNSSWYMFAIFVLYLMTYLCFQYLDIKKATPLIAMTALSLIYILVITQLKPDRYTNTFLCYVAGMWYSYYKEHIDAFFNEHYYSCFAAFMVCLSVIYVYMFVFKDIRIFLYNFASILFCLFVVIVSMKITFHSVILYQLGENTFWLYMLQRIPMMILKYYHIDVFNNYLYVILCFLITIMLTYFVKKVTTLSNRLLQEETS